MVAALAGLWPAATRYGWAVQNIEAMQGHLGRWVAANTPPDARLAVNDVGAIGYLSRREIVDVMGLVTPAILPYRRDGEAGVLRYLERACPDYLIVFPRWFPRLAAMVERFTPIYRVRARAQYHRRRRGDGRVRDHLEPREPGAAPLSRRGSRVYNGVVMSIGRPRSARTSSRTG